MAKRKFYLMGMFLLFTLSFGCRYAKHPRETARRFWHAMETDNIEVARKFTTVESRHLLVSLPVRFPDMNV